MENNAIHTFTKQQHKYKINNACKSSALGTVTRKRFPSEMLLFKFRYAIPMVLVKVI